MFPLLNGNIEWQAHPFHGIVKKFRIVVTKRKSKFSSDFGEMRKKEIKDNTVN